MKRFSAIMLCVMMLFALAASACAADSGYTDVRGNEWYAEAVMALREKGIMDGVGDNRFDPDGVFTRAQLATVLYRLADKPAVSGEDGFTDTSGGQWYSDAVLWASQNGIVSGYGNGMFGTTDPTTQEQLAVMLWRSAGSYVLDSSYADANGAENAASDWAVDAVRWARVDGLLTDAIPFLPKQPATRAQVADMVSRYLQLLERFSDVDAVSGATPKAEKNGKKILVACFSCTGNTERIAGYIAGALDADICRIAPETPYTAEDLNYSDSSTRATKEQNDPAARPAISGKVENMADYDVVFLGYPIWWGQAPKIMYTFIESYDLEGKTIVPFCTSGSSGIGSSAANLSRSASNAVWLEGRRFGADTAEADVRAWVDSLGLDADKGEAEILLTAAGTELTVEWAENSSVDALRELLRKSGPITLDMSDYGGFEKGAPLPETLPQNNEQMNTDAGDVILYQGKQFVIYYDKNSWSLTPLGRITGMTKAQLQSLLGTGNVTVTLALAD